MSRSYKKTPYRGDRKQREDKRTANRTFRSKMRRMGIEDEVAPAMYKRCYCSWIICDHYSITTLSEWLKRKNDAFAFGFFHPKGENYDEAADIRKWYKMYKRK